MFVCLILLGGGGGGGGTCHCRSFAFGNNLAVNYLTSYPFADR